MPKKSSGRTKGILRGLLRHRVGNKDVANREEIESSETKSSQFIGLNRSKVSFLGKKCFDFMLTGCEKLRLVNFKRTKSGEYVPLNRKDQMLHYSMVAICLALCAHKTWGSFRMLVDEELRMESFMCLSLAVVYDVSATVSLGVVLKPQKTMDLHNSWAYVSDSLKLIHPGIKCHPMDNIVTSLKIISGFLVTQGIAIAAPVCSLILSGVPTFYYPTAQQLGLLPDGVLPTWAWQIILAPLEWILQQPFMLLSSVSAGFLFMQNGLLDIYLVGLRNVSVRCMKSRRRLEQMYVQLELFNRFRQVWIRFYFPAWLLALSSGVIVTAFVTIRCTELPFFFYIFFPYTAMILMALIFRQSYDMFCAIRSSEDILGGLWRHDAPYFGGMPRAKRIEKMKRSKAMRPLVFPLGDSEFSLDLPISTWDEIINQTLFLLSL